MLKSLRLLRCIRGVLLSLFCLIPGLVLGNDSTHTDNGHYAWLDVNLNATDYGAALLWIVDAKAGDVDNGAALWIETSQLQGWGLLEAGAHVTRQIDDVSFSAINSVTGMRAQRLGDQLILQIDPQRLRTQYINAGRTAEATVSGARGRGLHFNYDALLTHNSGQQDWSGAAFLEGTAYNARGHFMSSGSVRYDPGTDQSELVRLDTVWNQDFSAQLTRLSLGDFIGAMDSMDSRDRVAGIRYKREYSLRPTQRNFAVPTLTGLATLPSEVDLYINGVRHSHFSAPSGPFEYSDAPVVSGAGQAQLVLTNVLGEQTVQSIRYYVDPELLRQGGSDFDLSAGWQRESYLTRSFDYGAFIAAGQWRYGLRDDLTIELRSRLATQYSNAEVRSTFQVFDLPVTAQVGAGGYYLEDGDSGALGHLGFKWHHHRYFAGVQTSFAQAPSDPATDPLPLHRQVLASTGMQLGVWTLSYDSLYRRRALTDRFSSQSLRLSRSWQSDWGHLALSSALYRTDDALSVQSTGLNLLLSYAPDAQQTYSISDQQDEQHQVNSQFSYRPASGLGQHWRAQHSRTSERQYWTAQLDSQHRPLQWRARAYSDGETESAQLGIQGAVGRINQRWFASRALGDSYALVDLYGNADVPVYLHNRVVGHSDSRGLAIVPQLLSYQDNRLHLNPLDLPLGTAWDGEDLLVSPAANTGLYVAFPLESGRAVQFALMQAPALPVPRGAVIRQADHAGTYYVGERGESYIAELTATNTEFRAYWQDQQCRFVINLPESNADVLPHLGAVRCL